MTRVAARAVLVVALALAVAGPLWALPSLRGAGGLVEAPNAAVGGGSIAFIRSGRVETAAQTVALNVAEVGLLNREGTNFYSAKVQALPDVSSDLLWVPSLAVGVRGIADHTRNREFFLALSKTFTYPRSVLTAGMTRQQSWSRGRRTGFVGIEVPISGRLGLLGEYLADGARFNAGAVFGVSRTFGAFDYILDVRPKKGRVAGANENIFGVWYRKRF